MIVPDVDGDNGTCYGSGDVSGHAYSVAFDTCFVSDGVYGDWTKGSAGSWVLDSGSNAHVNATFWYAYFTSSGAYQGLELGYWKGAPDNNCYYAGTFIGSTYTGHCLQNAGSNPSSASFWIQAQSAGSEHYNVYVNDTELATYTIPITKSSRVSAGYEEQSSTLLTGISDNLSPVGTFSSLLYHGANTQGWYDWNSHSRCQVDYNKGESFGAGTYSTSFKAQIGGSAGNYSGCTGSTPTSSRSNW